MKNSENKTKTPEVKIYRLKMSVYTGGIWLAIKFMDIICLKTAGNYTEISLSTTSVQYCVLHPLDKFEHDLPGGFFRCCRSAIVNLAYIECINTQLNTIQLNNREKIHVSQTKIGSLKKRLESLPDLTVPCCNHCEICDEMSKCSLIRPFLREDRQSENGEK
jgi:DNA-binding LytR/AlgR family response regulator